MKSEKGITLGSLAVYVVVVLIVLGILATVTVNFESVIKNINSEGTKDLEVDKFNMYLLKETKKQGIGISSLSTSEVTFSTGNKYTFKENGIYLNDNIKIAESIENCEFSSDLQNGKNILSVTIKAKKGEQKTIEYVLNDNIYYSSYEDESKYVYDNVENNL